MSLRLHFLRSGLNRFLKDESGAAMIEAGFTITALVLMMYGVYEVSSYVRARDHVNKIADQMAEVLATMPEWPQQLAAARALSPDVSAVPSEVTYLLRNVPETMAGDYGVKVHVLFCDGIANASDSKPTEYKFETLHKNGDCSNGLYPSESELIKKSQISCANLVDSKGRRYGMMESRVSLQQGNHTASKVPIVDINGQPGQQFVAVYAGCSYRPWLSAIGGLSGSRVTKNTAEGAQEEQASGTVIERITIIPMRNKMKWYY